MPGFQDSAVIVLLALLLFGPKKLPVLARQLGKLMADFRRASNEFRTQMEEELRISEQADRQKQVAAIEAAKPATPALEAPPNPAPATETQPDGQSGDTPDLAARTTIPTRTSPIPTSPQPNRRRKQLPNPPEAGLKRTRSPSRPPANSASCRLPPGSPSPTHRRSAHPAPLRPTNPS